MENSSTLKADNYELCGENKVIPFKLPIKSNDTKS